MEDLKLGLYQHFKGGYYEVIGLAEHTETLEEMVIYRSYSKEKELWVRPKEMFLGNVLVDGQEVPRFRYISEL